MVGLGEVAVQPVGEVETSVDTESEKIVRRDGLSLSGALEHEQLGKNGDSLEPDGESPENLREGVLVGEKQSENSSTGEQVLDLEGIDVGIVGRLVGVGHEVDDVSLGADEHDLEEQVVETVGCENI